MYRFHGCHGYTDTYLEQVVVMLAIGRSCLAWQIILAGCQKFVTLIQDCHAIGSVQTKNVLITVSIRTGSLSAPDINSTDNNQP